MVAAVGEQDVLIWKENAATVEVFSAMLTQWNVGPGGVIGLRYEALPALLEMSRIPAADLRLVFGGLRVMERAALEHFSHG
jgi:hypothetical protein